MWVRFLGWLLVVSAPAGAQCFHVPDDMPALGRCNLIPFGAEPGSATWSNQFYQTLVTKADLMSTPGLICGLAFAPCATSTATVAIDRVVIRMDHILGGTLDTTFANNMTANAVTVLDATDYAWPVSPGQWNNIGLAAPFDYDPAKGDLVVEISVDGTGLMGSADFGMRSHDGRQRVFAVGFAGAPPAVAQSRDMQALKMRVCLDTATTETFGTGCPASKPLTLTFAGSSVLGNNLDVIVSNGPATGAGIVLIGFSNTPGFPLDLTVARMPGCTLYVASQLCLGFSFSSGTGMVQLGIPNVAEFSCGIFFTQAIAADPPATPIGLSASDYGRVVAGN